MTRKMHITPSLMAVFLFLGIGSPTQAGPGGSIAPKISAAIPYYDEDLLIIFGTGLFNDMTPPKVTIAGNEYETSVTEDGEVLVYVNLNLISPGDYLLVLEPDHRAPARAEFMLTLGATNAAATVPSSYSVDTDFFWVDDAVQRAVIGVHCHPGDFAVGGAWFASPEDSTVFVGGGSGGRGGYFATLANSVSEFGVRVIASCLDFSEPLHREGSEFAICNYDPEDPGDYDCYPGEH